MQATRRSTTPPFFLLLLLLLPVLAAGAGDLITAACNHTLYFRACVSSLRSDPRTRRADLRGLAAISIDLSAAHANKTVSYLKKMKAEAVIGTRPAACFGDCLEQYGDAADNLREAAEAHAESDYGTVNAMVSAAMTDADSCENGFDESKGAPPPPALRKRNGYFCKLCSNSLALTALLS